LFLLARLHDKANTKIWQVDFSWKACLSCSNLLGLDR
jgi:hypothetical protein